MDLRAIFILTLLSPVLAFVFIVLCGFTFRSTLDLQLSFSDFFKVLQENWIIILLVFSELSTFLPTKWNGIVQYIVAALFRAVERKSKFN